MIAMAFCHRGTLEDGGACPIHVPTKGTAASLPLGVLYDFASTFPSVGHAWLLLVLETIEQETAYFCAIQCLYEENHAYVDNGALLTCLFPHVSGILQGCPI